MKDLPKQIFLIGYMGCGKSTVCKLLADKIGYKHVDMDEQIEKDEGIPIRKIFAIRGEHHFRNQEAKLLDRLCEEEGIVVSCGGGIICDDLNIRQLQQNGRTIFIKTDIHTLFDRVKNDENRPLAYLEEKDEDEQFRKFSSLYSVRQERYIQAAHTAIEADGLTPEEIANKIIERL